MTASIMVTTQATNNTPPTVSITAPADGSTFAAPWTGTIQASAADSDGMVTNIKFMANATLLGTISNPSATPSFTVTNLAAGSYALTAVATDNGGASTTSAVVNITVTAPGGIMLGSPQLTSAGSFRFSYTASIGSNYAVDRSTNLLNWIPLSTNNASTIQVTFTNSPVTGSRNFYRVRRVSP
jgi:hypothetical protein